MENRRYLTLAELSRYGPAGTLSERAFSLLAQQKETWELLSANYGALNRVETRRFRFGAFRIECQFNPGRIRSSAADTSAGAIRARPCFLCPENRPLRQSGIPLPGDFELLINPYPIFPCHLTLSSLSHIPQQIRGNVSAFLQFCEALDRFTLFYNGPQCGASAPDHLHFQGAVKRQLPIGEELDKVLDLHGEILVHRPGFTVSAADDGLRRFLAFRSTEAEILADALETAVTLCETTPGEEPMVNLLGWADRDGWLVLLFPRALQRPWQYFAEEPRKLLVSPAAVELAGLVVLPREEDFRRIGDEDLVSIFNQVTAGKADFAFLKEKICNSSRFQ